MYVTGKKPIYYYQEG